MSRTYFLTALALNPDWKDVLRMRERVKTRFNIDFDGANPFHSLLVAEAEARIAPETEQSVVRCFGGCGKFFDGFEIVNRRFTPYNKCTNCAFEIFEDEDDYDRNCDYGGKYSI